MDYTQLIDTILERRGVLTEQEKDAFLNPSYSAGTHDPFLLAGMKEAVARIIDALIKEEQIVIYSDFDADGIPAGVLLHDFFKKIGYENIVNYIPHRDTEGYGLHKEAIEKLVKGGAGLLITVDVGITSVESVAFGKELGIDIIITDHHEPLQELPQAFAVINPKQSHCKYPFDGLCGSGVAYKVVQGVIAQAGKMKDEKNEYIQNIQALPDGWEKWLLDLVAIATVADMVPLVDENRALVSWGMHVLHKSPRVGLRALCKKLRINQAMLNEGDIGFSIGPRINASSRMGCPEDAFNLLATTSLEEAEALASRLESLNNKRKGAVAAISRQVKGKVLQIQEDLGEGSELSQVVVTGDPAWSPALVGLAAGSISDSLGRMVCIWGREGTGTLKGSCRSGGNGSVVGMFEAAGDELLYYGGHHAAGGFAVADEKVHTLEEVLNTALSATAGTDKPQEDPMLEADLEALLPDVNHQLHKGLIQLAPFGMGNPKPIIAIKQVAIASVRHFGKEQNHIEVYIKDTQGNTRKMSKFFATATSFTSEVREGEVVDVFANLEESAFAGRRTLELRIIDIV
jgi:single-stranded-DNA-specific exonuclease